MNLDDFYYQSGTLTARVALFVVASLFLARAAGFNQLPIELTLGAAGCFYLLFAYSFFRLRRSMAISFGVIALGVAALHLTDVSAVGELGFQKAMMAGTLFAHIFANDDSNGVFA